MAKEIQSELIIDEEKINHFTSIYVNQKFNDHHSFEIIVPQEVLEKQGTYALEKSQKLIGKSVTLSFGEKNTSDNIFKGIITEVGMHQEQGLWGNIILKGYSPTYLFEGGAHHSSYYKKNLKSIIDKLKGDLPAHEMRLTINPKFTKEITYMTQYGESNFKFINRLASDYGEWFYYDGAELFFGKPSQVANVELLYGADIHVMSFSMKVIPSKVTHYSYNSKSDEVNKSDLPGNVPGNNAYVKAALQASDELYSHPVVQPAGIRIADKQQLDEYAKKQKGTFAASAVQLTVHGDNPKVKLGNHVTVKVIQKEIKGEDTPQHGEYIVTSISHYLSGIGEYTHTFEGIPSDNDYIPVTVDSPAAETQMAIVKENNDPDGMGRVRVQMLWQQQSGQMTDWIRVLTPDGGSSDKVSKNRGFVFIPEVGDQVLLGFRYNDPNRPFVLGSVFHGKTASGGGSGNKSKSMTTRSGSTVTMDDDKKSVTISDPSGNTMVYDGAGNVTVDSPKTMTLTCGESSITLNKNGTIEITGKNITVNGSTKAEMSSGGAGFIADSSGDKADVTGKATTITGTATAVVTAPDTTINGDAKTGITSSGPTSIEGCIVKLN